MQLLRALGFFHVNMFLFSATIGTGIFVSPKAVLKYCSLNIPIFLSVWAGCGLLSMMNAVCLAEIAATYPIAEAILQVYYAYLGSSVLIIIAGEIKRPAETIPKSIIYGLSVVTMLYLLTNVSFVAVLTSEEIISSDSVAVTWMNRVFPSMQWIISLLTSAFLFGSVSCGIVSASRMFFVASQDGQFPFIYSMLNDHHSPVVADIQAVILSSVGIISSNMIYLVKYVGLGAWCLNLPNMIGLLKLRYQNPDLPRPYKVRLLFLFGSIASSLFLILTPVIQSPSTEHVYQVVFLFCGLLCYWLQAYLNRHGVCFNRITCYWQLLFNVSPSEHPEKLIPSLNPIKVEVTA
ncbi:solute carrier family 7 member 12-like isoform X2 [Rattus norvegicus]|uniref:solute carrier family 7 member 12-like isoform X2 n=1 Tax=Rattus norvegicus TaxID=10116 RepID=UPI002FD87B3D